MEQFINCQYHPNNKHMDFGKLPFHIEQRIITSRFLQTASMHLHYFHIFVETIFFSKYQSCIMMI